MAMPEPERGSKLEDLPDVMTARQAAGVLQCSEKHIHEMCRREQIPSFKVGRLVRIPKAQLAKWIEG